MHYLEVCTGPIERQDAGQRYATEAQGLEKSAAGPGGGVKLKGIPAAWLARRIEVACRKRKAELIVPFYSRYLFAVAQLLPVWSDRILLAWRKRG